MSSTETTWLTVADLLETSTTRKQTRRNKKTKDTAMDNRTAALMVCSAIGSNNIDDMATVLAAMTRVERQAILDMAERIKGTVMSKSLQVAPCPKNSLHKTLKKSV